MKRNINLISNSCITNVNNCENIHIDNLDSLIDFSVDNIFYSMISKIEKTQAKKIIDILFTKIRPEGSIIITFEDAKLVCQNYLNNYISNQELLLSFRDTKNIISVDEIMTYIDVSKFVISSITRKNTNIIVSVTRISV